MRPEPEALEIFQRIRTSSYDDIFTLLRQVRDNSYGFQPNLQHIAPATTGIDQRLPPIQAILDVSSRPVLPSPGHSQPLGHPTHAHLVHSHSLSSDDSRNSSIPEYTPGPPSGPPQPQQLLSTLEPTLHPSQQQQHLPHHPVQTPPLPGSKPSLSSEDSTGSINSTAGYGIDPSQNPYHTP